AAHPSIAQVAIVGVPDDRLGEVGKAFVIATSGREVNTEELIAWCRENMANYKVPRFVEVVDALPLNASGKVLKYDLRVRSLHLGPRRATGGPRRICASSAMDRWRGV